MLSTFWSINREHAYPITKGPEVGGSETQGSELWFVLPDIRRTLAKHSPSEGGPAECPGSGNHVTNVTIVLSFLTTGSSDGSYPMCQAPHRGLQMLDPKEDYLSAILEGRDSYLLTDEESEAQRGSSDLPRLTELVNGRTKA